MKDKIDTRKSIHCHVAWFGSDLACKECNPVCWENHQMDNPNHLKWCGKKDCPMNPKNFGGKDHPVGGMVNHVSSRDGADGRKKRNIK
jgi:hypothetical protein